MEHRCGKTTGHRDKEIAELFDAIDSAEVHVPYNEPMGDKCPLREDQPAGFAGTSAIMRNAPEAIGGFFAFPTDWKSVRLDEDS
ncbi:MAG: hypothetical protein Kow00107_06180 [Planctomycetota bacterium]